MCVSTRRTLERHEAASCGGVASHVDVHVVVGPVVLVVVVESVRGVRQTVSATGSRRIGFQGAIARARSLPPGRRVRWQVVGGEV